MAIRNLLGGSCENTKSFTRLCLFRDIAIAEGRYTKLLGRKPDFRPMDTLVQWEIGETGGLKLTSDPKLAAHGAMSVVVDDIEAERSRLDGSDISLGDSTRGTYSALAQVKDPDAM